NPALPPTVTATGGSASGIIFDVFGFPIITPATPQNITITPATNAFSSPFTVGADDVADYSNVVSNQIYGPTIGCGSECYLGWGFSCSLDVRATLGVDMVREIAKYEREDHYIS